MSEREEKMDEFVVQMANNLRETGLIPEEEIFPVVADCMTFLGKMVEMFENVTPSVAKTAAIVLFVERLRMEQAGGDAMVKVAAVVNACQRAFQKASESAS